MNRTIATILLHMAGDRRHHERLQVAVALARRFEAFLDIVHAGNLLADGDAMAGRGLSPAQHEEAAAMRLLQAQGIEAEVRRACHDISYAWTRIEELAQDQLLQRAGCADLAVIGLPAEDEAGDARQLAEQLPLLAPCPVLILPGTGPVALPPGQNVLVAWKSSREAGRALREALPFLQRAERVTVLTVDPAFNRRSEANDLLVFLERHGIEAEFQPDDAPDNEAGDAILAAAQELECDLIVMGGCDHSRLHDLMVGSATRSVLNRTELPVLMAH